MIEAIVSYLIGLFLVGFFAFGWLNLTHYLRMRRVKRLYESLPTEARESILSLIDQAGSQNPDCVVLVAVEPTVPSAENEDIIASHFGGRPYQEPGESWPQGTDDPPQAADFLIQVRLPNSFPPPWPGRLITIFNRFDVDQTVRCYPSPDRNRYQSAMEGAGRPLPRWDFRAIRIPDPKIASASNPACRTDLLSYDPVVLLESVSNLQSVLDQHTSRPADLLAAILAPNHCGYGFELSDIVQLGGRPIWLIDELEGLDCDYCKRSMRFLFQFGDLNHGHTLGDGGVCYVFGCDEHSDHLRAIVQM